MIHANCLQIMSAKFITGTQGAASFGAGEETRCGCGSFTAPAQTLVCSTCLNIKIDLDTFKFFQLKLQ
jgi:hypothetical protein